MRAERCQVVSSRLSFRTHELSEGTLERFALVDLLAGREDISSWVHEERGLIDLGRALVIEAYGAERIEALRAAWRVVVGAAWWRDVLARPGTGPMALGAITSSSSSEQSSVLMVPEVLVGLDDFGVWLATAVSRADDGTEPEHSDPGLLLTALMADVRATVDQEQAGTDRDSGDPGGTTAVEVGVFSEEQWCRTACATQERMRAGQTCKVVLVRDVLAYPGELLATGTILRRLVSNYFSTWVFAVDQMVGTSPELLLRLRDRRLMSRMLAGMARRHAGEDVLETACLAPWLEGSGKNNREHELARDSAIMALEPLCPVVEAPARFVLMLPNVLHLANDTTGVVTGDAGALALMDALHPTAAVCGTPTQTAACLIEEAESMDRGRYTGSVGWVDWYGEGEWCIALRSAQLPVAGPGPQSPVRVFGGSGIMPDSGPVDELVETTAKMCPMLGTLGALG